MPTPTVGQTVTFKWSNDPAADTAVGVAAQVIAGRVIIVDARDAIGPFSSSKRFSTTLDVAVAEILTAT